MQPTFSHTGEGWEAHDLATLSDVCCTTGPTILLDVAVNTLSGLFMRRLKRIPEIGDRLVEDGFGLIVKRLEEQRVGTVEIRVTLSPPEEAGDPSPS